MIICYLMLVLGIIFGFLSQKTTQKKRLLENGETFSSPSGGMVFLVFFPCLFFLGLRSGMFDTAAYKLMYASTQVSSLKFDWDEKGPIFTFFTQIIKMIFGSDFHYWLFIIAFIQIILIVYIVHKYSRNVLISFVYFMFSTAFTWIANGMRQFLAVTLLLLAADFLVRKKYLKFAIISLLAFGIHQTALVGIVALLISLGKPFNWKTLFSIGAILIAVIFVNNFTDFLDNALEDTAYAGSTSQFAEDDGVHPLRIILAAVPMALYLCIKKNFKYPITKMDSLCVNLSVFAIGFDLIGMVTSGILIGRLEIYCSIFYMILYPYLFEQGLNAKDRLMVKTAYILGYFLFFYLQTGNFYYISDILGLFIT